jgi:hypothetical protein
MRNYFLVVVLFLAILVVGTDIHPAPVQAQAESIALNRSILPGCQDPTVAGLSNGTYMPLTLSGLDTSAYYRVEIRVRKNVSGPHYMSRVFVQQPRSSTVDPFGLYIFEQFDPISPPVGSTLPFPMEPGNQTFIDVKLFKSPTESGTYTNVATFRMYRYNCVDGTYDSIVN